MRTRLAVAVILLSMLLGGCAAPAGRHNVDPELAHVATIALAPIGFSSDQTLRIERDAIAGVLEKALTEQLGRRGYTVVALGTRPAAARLDIVITYVWDGRLYGGDDPPSGVLYPEMRLYATATLTDSASGRVLLRRDVEGSGLIDTLLSPAPEARYAAPQQDLARRISHLFPRR